MARTTVKNAGAKSAQVILGDNAEFSVQPKASAKAGWSESDRRRLIAEAAYYIAESKGFNPETEIENWIEAERQINARLAK